MNNCLLWAVKAWRKRGGYLCFRASAWGPFPHCIWAPRISIESQSFSPNAPRMKTVPPILFPGSVVSGDEPPQKSVMPTIIFMLTVWLCLTPLVMFIAILTLRSLVQWSLF